LGVEIDGVSETYVHLQPALEIATELEPKAGILLRPRLSVGFTQFLGDSAPSITGRLADAPTEIDSFSASTRLDRTRLDIAADLDVFARNKMVIRAGAIGTFSENSRGYGMDLKLEVPF
jgi:hypothetical protein